MRNLAITKYFFNLFVKNGFIRNREGLHLNNAGSVVRTLFLKATTKAWGYPDFRKVF
jgi:hypothetical protein